MSVLEEIASALFDYGRLYRSCDSYRVAVPRTVEEIQGLVRAAGEAGTALRVRGGGHTMSGSSLPRANEILVRMSDLDHYCFEHPGTVTVGAGAIMWDVRDFVARHGWWIPVYHGGWAGPTIGGFVTAGGMGAVRAPTLDEVRQSAASGGAGEAPDITPTSLSSAFAEYLNSAGGLQSEGNTGGLTGDGPTGEDLHLRPSHDSPGWRLSVSELQGGFWEHVVSVTMVDGRGDIQEIHESDDDFPWIFGSLGQFGIIVKVKLKLLPIRIDVEKEYPLGQSGRIPRVQTEDPAVHDGAPPPGGAPAQLWFTLLISPEQEKAAWAELGSMARRHYPFLKAYQGSVGPTVGGRPIGYRFPVPLRRFHPPLVYSRAEDFLMIGLMAVFSRVGHSAVDDRIFKIASEFREVVLRNRFHMYHQAENIAGHGLDYESYFGRDNFRAFHARKKKFDPSALINPGIVFGSDTDPPVKNSAGGVDSDTASKNLNDLLQKIMGSAS